MIISNHVRVLACFFLMLSSLVFAPAHSAKLFVPEVQPWDMWLIADQTNEAEIDHSVWQQLLNIYLDTDTRDGINRFDYAGVTAADRVRLRNYIERLTSMDPRNYTRGQQLPYWINLYNAVTVELVIDYYPVSSIRRIKGGLLGTGPWDEVVVTVAGHPLTLNDIEHRILRPIWRDPRIHYTVNCASLGCPNLAALAYTAANTEDLMEQGARQFINHPRGVDLAEGRLTLSSIYNWFDTDFGADQAERLEHMAEYAEEPLASELRTWQGRIRYDYNWKLNATD